MKLFLGFGLVSLLASGCATPSGKCTTPDGGIVLNCGEDTAVPDSDTHTGDSDSATDSDSSGETGDSDTDTGETGIVPVDADGDGHASLETGGDDCDDVNADVHPGAEEACNGKDDDCDGAVDEDVESTWYSDADGDGYGDASISVDACDPPSGYVADATDCDDGDVTVHPYAEESCDDTADKNCDGSFGYSDADGDLVPACEDCDDTNAAVHTGAIEVCDGLDNDCDTSIDNDATDALTYYADVDGDTYGDSSNTEAACSAPAGYVSDSTDCNDTRSDINPGENEQCDGSTTDENCNGLADDADPTVLESGKSHLFHDADGDAYGDPATDTLYCSSPDGSWIGDSTDCDDGNAGINPGAPEVCNGVDDDCDTKVDEAGAYGEVTWYADVDGDGYGDPADSSVACDASGVYSTEDDQDCDDGDAGVNPSATEVCNGIDDDCTGSSDDGLDYTTWHIDGDGDGYGGTSTTSTCDSSAPAGYCADATDCDDGDATVHPGASEIVADGIDQNCDGADSAVADADSDGDPDSTDCAPSDSTIFNGAIEVCNGLDDDCDGAVDEFVATTYYADNDVDGYGDPLTAEDDCAAPTGYVTNSSDCDDTEAAAYTGAPETCDGVDNDCDGAIDEGVSSTYYADADGDGYGDSTSSMEDCTVPSGYTADDTDCDDTRAWAYPGGSEVCWEAVDADCDGVSGECFGGLTGPNLFESMATWDMESPIGSGTVSGIVTVSGSAPVSDCTTAETDSCSAKLQGPGSWTIESSLSATAGVNMFCFASLLGSDSSVPTTVEVYRGATRLTSVSHEAFDGGWTPTSEMGLVVPATAGTITMKFTLTGSDAVWVDAVDCQQ